jgi:hypothetical protein
VYILQIICLKETQVIEPKPNEPSLISDFTTFPFWSYAPLFANK